MSIIAGARVIEITDADTFFSALSQGVQTLKETHRQNPESIELLVSSTKRYLARPEYRIQFDELFTGEAERLIALLDAPDLQAGGSWTQEEFRARVRRYEAATEPLARMAGVLGRWGDNSEFPIVLDLLRAIRAHADKILGGLVIWLDLRLYPAVLIFTAYGLGLTRAERWSALHTFFMVELTRAHDEPQRIVQALFLGTWHGGSNDSWRHMEGLERCKTALSDHLLAVFTPWAKSFAGVSPEFELLFEKFEILASLAYLDSVEKVEIEAALAETPPRNWLWIPIGRSGWHSSIRNRLSREIQTERMTKALIDAGFGRGRKDHFDLALENFGRLAARIEWVG